MIIAKTPIRISFAGGGSDLHSFYKNQLGAVVSTTIDKYIFVTVNKNFDAGVKLKYSKSEDVKKVTQLKHNRAKAILNYLKLDGGLEISSLADIPSKGTGLGSSSSFTVALLHALHTYKQEYASPEQLAQEACRIEIDILKEPIGKQDQYAAAYGGLNFIQFNPDKSVFVDPIICKQETILKLEGNLLILFTGITRSASSILSSQKKNMETETKKTQIMKKMVALARDLKNELQKNNVEVFGQILHENWLLKKEMASGISNDKIDYWYNKAMKAGATGGKLLGAGGGGFLLFYAPKEKHDAIKRSLKSLRPLDFKFDYQGSKIIFIHD
ncbi:MAG: GHMP kinase [bacterium]|nr:GHMP kinase [bacterium]